VNPSPDLKRRAVWCAKKSYAFKQSRGKANELTVLLVKIRAECINDVTT